MAATDHLEGAAVLDLRAGPVFSRRDLGQRGGEIELGERAGGVAKRGRLSYNFV